GCGTRSSTLDFITSSDSVAGILDPPSLGYLILEEVDE
nr:hypothetical protein [Tanacetum cinerariifolium]